ncbi:MAG: hypothetical protein JWO72_2298 [Caulobacteraceae bacterium]|nr:hypothetical protein [Caulobacteraceae bacterium]
MALHSPAADTALVLLADDADHLQVISATLQDAVCTVGDISFEKASRRLTVSLNRFRWEAAAARSGGQRVRAGLQLGGVLDVKAKRLRRDASKAILSLLAVSFEAGDAPGGVVSLTFAGGGELRVEVECIDAVLADVSRPWPTPRRPAHDLSGS